MWTGEEMNNRLVGTHQNSIGGQVMATARIHTTRIMSMASRFDLLRFEYFKGCVTAKYLRRWECNEIVGGRTICLTYLSILIAHKLNIEAVHRRTSKLIQMSHSTRPSCHLSAGRLKRSEDGLAEEN